MDHQAPSFSDFLRHSAEHILDACTKCGACATACPMTVPAEIDTSDAPALVSGILDLIGGGAGTPAAERWATVCSNSGKCIPACEHGINPRLMINLARVASKAKQGEAVVRKAGNAYFNNMSRGTRTISRMLLPPETLQRLNPALKAPDEYDTQPEIVFYTGCNVVKTPHIALTVLEVLDAIGVRYEVMGGNAICCGIQQFKQGDAKTAGRVGYNSIERLGRAGASRVIAWCPSCHIQFTEVALPAYAQTHGEAPFDMAPVATFLAEHLDELRKHFVKPVNKRVAIQKRSALPEVVAAVDTILRAIPGLEVVDLGTPVVSTQSVHLNVVPKYKAELYKQEFEAAHDAGLDAYASLFHGCHRDLVPHQQEVGFQLINFMELIGEAMGFHAPDMYKRLSMMADIDAVLADTADMIAANGVDLETARDVVASEIFGGR